MADGLLAWLPVNQDVLLPFAGFLVGAVNAACPTAWAFSAFKKLLYGSPDPPLTGLFPLGIFNPTKEFVSRNRRQIFPALSDLFRPG
jgi:hypothetical protein